jgi:formylglycine-generating enzyme required for sulfatase activity
MSRHPAVAIALSLSSAFGLTAACGHHAPGPPSHGGERAGPCFDDQVLVEQFCIDRYEDFVVEIDPDGSERPHSPYDVIGDHRVRAKVAADVVPQAYISQVQARAACAEAGKRLCKAEEYVRACRGPNKNDFYPYGGTQRKHGLCNEGKGSFVAMAHGQDFSKLTYEEFNDPKLDQLPNGLARTGAFPHCVSPEGIFDLVGNLHEWVDEESAGHGRFRGGWYGDAENNGPGCLYVTTAHEPTYHDYSTGFRCCADPGKLGR